MHAGPAGWHWRVNELERTNVCCSSFPREKETCSYGSHVASSWTKVLFPFVAPTAHAAEVAAHSRVPQSPCTAQRYTPCDVNAAVGAALQSRVCKQLRQLL